MKTFLDKKSQPAKSKSTNERNPGISIPSVPIYGVLQKQKSDEEEVPLQGMFSIQKKDADEEELLQQKPFQLVSAEDGDLPTQKKTNITGMPDHLKGGIEKLSGFSMDDVKVHYNSAKPNQL